MSNGKRERKRYDEDRVFGGVLEFPVIRSCDRIQSLIQKKSKGIKAGLRPCFLIKSIENYFRNVYYGGVYNPFYGQG